MFFYIFMLLAGFGLFLFGAVLTRRLRQTHTPPSNITSKNPTLSDAEKSVFGLGVLGDGVSHIIAKICVLGGALLILVSVFYMALYILG